MKTLALLVAPALLAATPALAQSSTATPPEPTSDGTAMPVSPDTQPPLDAPEATDAQAPPSDTPSTTNQASAVDATIANNFTKYDADGSGTLSSAEFAQWIGDLKAQELAAAGKPADPKAVKQYAAAALKAADTDSDGNVTKGELRTFLGG